MPDFSKALQSLKAADLAYIQRIAGSAPDADMPDKAARKRRSGSGTGDAAGARNKPRRSGGSHTVPLPSAPGMDEEDRAGTDHESGNTSAVKPLPGTSDPDMTIRDAVGSDMSGRETAARDKTQPDGIRQPTSFSEAAGHDTAGSNATSASREVPGLPTEKARTRRAVAHEWPPVGTLLSATYFGVEYRAEVVVATKRLKSGKQVRLLDGPAKGKRLDSFSKAMLVATAKQRREQKLGRKGTSNGWGFWRQEGAA